MLKDSIKIVATTTVHCATVTLLFASFNIAAQNLHQDISHIAPNSLNNVDGITTINMAAGSNNAQTNIASIAIGKNAKAINKSFIQVRPSSTTGISSATINRNTLHNAQGIIAINQAAGSGNAQLNDIAIAFGNNIEVISDAALMVHLPTDNKAAPEAPFNNTVYLDKDALKGASGSIQVNQIAGSGNVAVNRVSMPIK